MDGDEANIRHPPVAVVRSGGHAAIMKAVDANLRLSAQRALLGAIHPGVRMVKVRRDGFHILLTAICDRPFSDNTLDAISTAAAEIGADFPECEVDENVIGSNEPLPQDDVLAEGWVFQRAG